MTEEGVYDTKIIKLSDEQFKRKNFAWEDYYRPEAGEIITEIDLFKDHTILYLEKEGVFLLYFLYIKRIGFLYKSKGC